jgi:hypothetical protein
MRTMKENVYFIISQRLDCCISQNGLGCVALTNYPQIIRTADVDFSMSSMD